MKNSEYNIATRLLFCHDKPEQIKNEIIDEASLALEGAALLIAYIGTTGAERTDVIRKSEEWLKVFGFENRL